jgi:hypothetical protein
MGTLATAIIDYHLSFANQRKTNFHFRSICSKQMEVYCFRFLCSKQTEAAIFC